MLISLKFCGRYFRELPALKNSIFHFYRCMRNISDCCPSSNNDVLYENKKTLAGTDAPFKCKHNLTNTIYRTCIPSLQFGPRWSDVDMSKCLSARAVSQELQDLQNVSTSW